MFPLDVIQDAGLLPLVPLNASVAEPEACYCTRDSTRALQLRPILCQEGKLKSGERGQAPFPGAHHTFMAEVNSQVVSLPSPRVYN